MTAQAMEFFPPSQNRYPLYADTISGLDYFRPHELFECGDPDWCLHESAPEGALVELQPIPNAVNPAIYGNKRYEFLRPEVVTDQLASMGFSYEHIKNIAFVLHDDLGYLEKNIKRSGYFHPEPFIGFDNDGEASVHKFAIHALAGRASVVNATFRHELGHLYKHVTSNETKKNQLAYNNQTNVRSAKIGGAVLSGLGIASEASLAFTHAYPTIPLGIAGIIGGTCLYQYPKYFLWYTNREERFCDRFAEKYASVNFVKEKSE